MSTPLVFKLALGVSLLASAQAQELPPSGIFGATFVYATSPSGTSQLYSIEPATSASPVPVGAPVAAVPSRWAHRRRTLGALETAISHAPPTVLFTPMGDSVGTGAIHFVDGRTGTPPTTALISTGNPAAYDILVAPNLKQVFTAEDDGAGNTVLRGFSYAVPGALTPTSPPSLSLAGAPAAYVNRMGYDPFDLTLHVPTATGIHIIDVAKNAPHMTMRASISSAPAAPSTNPARFDRNGSSSWIIGTSTFDSSGSPLAAGHLTWNAAGGSEVGEFGAVPSAPGKAWIPAAGCEELAVVGDGVDTFVYYLLREPGPGTFFVKPAAIGVIRLLGSSPSTVGTILCPENCGEPFANPAVHGTRVAFETSFGPPFIFTPEDGGEKVNVLYSPLDPLGSGDGVLGVPAPLGGRISTKGMDRPLWSADGSRIFAATSWFPGAPNPGVPGLEVLDVPATIPLNEYVAPHTVVPLTSFPSQSITFPSTFRPAVPIFGPVLADYTFAGHVSHDHMAACLAAPFGEIGQAQVGAFTQSAAIPNFRAVFPATFDDATSSTFPIPSSFGAHRVAFNVYAQFGLAGLVMIASHDDEILVQPTGFNTLAPFSGELPIDVVRLPLPTGWITTTELLAL